MARRAPRHLAFAVALALALVGCGGPGVAPPTPTPQFVRYDALDVIRAFNEAGLRADPPVLTTNTGMRNGLRAAVFDFLPTSQVDSLPTAAIIVTASPEQLAEARQYLATHNNNTGTIRNVWQIRRNIVVVFAYFPRAGSPDLSQYWAVLAALP